MASIAMPVLSAAVSARVSVRAKVSTRGLRAVGVKPLPVRPAAVRVSASAAAESQTDDLQLGQTAALTLAGALALGTEQASAASESLSQVAGFDSRALIFLGILGPAIGWVLYNILTPGLNQFNSMQEKNARGKKGIPLGLGLSAAALAGMPEQADAATELMQTAGLDARILIFGAFVPVLGWVAYNILKPGLNQIEDMQKKNAKKRGVAAGVTGLSAAALLGMPEQADAATELMQTAGLDARILIFGAFVPVLGWVAYNILKPGLNQIEDMQKKNAKRK
ncbi:photosystem II PsbY protein [Micromonas pusilla CCMP1545]|uniref:Photosystem II PsbY protein n=1 Tax=Micromonas pusilla (strain CCMP1545) TaxID=564608 RepID=C1MZ88_MICPC|nr:photosystem II PsbY protein [Micromonas pusilla CCMP1545]EEH54566.1 photosystem II PsbY protein [Micromonas pusilla CCMP1545]|eukprot:XP_003060916.1 photosystem II PsbY protein [Micromonas pusilla CCMP1545]